MKGGQIVAGERDQEVLEVQVGGGSADGRRVFMSRLNEIARIVGEPTSNDGSRLYAQVIPRPRANEPGD